MLEKLVLLAQAVQEKFPFSHVTVGMETLVIDDELFPLSTEAQEITSLCSKDWPTLTPRVVTLT